MTSHHLLGDTYGNMLHDICHISVAILSIMTNTKNQSSTSALKLYSILVETCYRATFPAALLEPDEYNFNTKAKCRFRCNIHPPVHGVCVHLNISPLIFAADEVSSSTGGTVFFFFCVYLRRRSDYRAYSSLQQIFLQTMCNFNQIKNR